jgi:cytochrome c-type biogenesis protein CcmH
MTFWIAAGVLSAVVAALLLLAVLRGQAGAAPAEGGEDMRVYRDQLREVERDVARGILSEREAERLRVEISRRILEADRTPARTAAQAAAPRAAVWVAAALVPVLVGGSFALYLTLGAPGYPDMPLASRIADARVSYETRPGQAEAEAGMAARAAEAAQLPPELPDQPDAGGAPAAGESEHAELVAQLRVLLQDRPDDLQGHRLLASGEAGLGDYAAAHRAQARVIELLGQEARAEEHVALAEMMILAAGGYVSPEAEAALRRALEIDPRNPGARYFIGLMMGQTGRPDIAFQVWRDLLEESRPDAPWVPAIRARIEMLAQLAGVQYRLPPEGAAPAAAGPSAEDLAAAQELEPEARDAMIRAMVQGLAGRLSREGGPAQDWARLIAAYGVLGEREEASAIWTEAQVVFGTRPDDLAVILEAAQQAGVAQ